MKKKLLSLILTLCMVVTLFPVLGASVFAEGEEATFTYTTTNGQEYTITQSDITRLGSEATFTPIKPNGDPNPGKAVTATFAKLTDLLDDKGITDRPECVYSFPCNDGSTLNYQPQHELCIYVAEDGTLNTAIDGGYGFLWAKDFVQIIAKNHVHDGSGLCQNQYTDFNPEINTKDDFPCNHEVTFDYTTTDGETFVIGASDITRLGSEATFTPIKPSGEPNPGKAVTATFAKLTDLLDDKGITDRPECVYSFPCNDTGTLNYQPQHELYIYVAEDGSLNTAIDGGYGFLWAKDFIQIIAKNHAYGSDRVCHNEYTDLNPDLGHKDTFPCGAVKPVKTITPAVTLSAKVFTWNGKVQMPKVTVKDGKTTLVNNRDYKITGAGGKNVGTYTVKVVCMGDYKGSKSVSFVINPKGTALSKVTAGKKKFTAKWKKQAAKMSTSAITGYQLQYSLKKTFKSGNKSVNVKGAKTVSKAVSKLKAKKTYYVRIRTYKKVSGKTYYSPWSAAKKVTTKK